jgi:hypothetical protein
MPKVALRYGHGANTYEDKHSKGVVVGGKVYEEHTFNAAVGVKVKNILQNHGVTVLEIQPPMGKDVPLSVGIKKANDWKADLFWSIHANAGTSLARGLCAFYWSTSEKGKKAAEFYAKYAKEEGLPLYHNGLWGSIEGTWNAFQELEDTNMVAVLTENGFMTNPEDFKLIFQNKDDFHNVCARINAKAILSYFGIKYKGGTTVAAPKPKEEDEMLGKAVVIGGYPDFAGAELVAARLKAPIYFRNALPSGIVAKELYVVGGSVEGLKAEKIINLTGANRFEVMEKVKKFLG